MPVEEWDIQYVEDEISKLNEIPEGSALETLKEDLGIPQWEPEFQRVLTALEKRRQELRLERIDKNTQDSRDDESLKILKIRYAKGEITKDEFEEMKKVLD